MGRRASLLDPMAVQKNDALKTYAKKRKARNTSHLLKSLGGLVVRLQSIPLTVFFLTFIFSGKFPVGSEITSRFLGPEIKHCTVRASPGTFTFPSSLRARRPCEDNGGRSAGPDRSSICTRSGRKVQMQPWYRVTI